MSGYWKGKQHRSTTAVCHTICDPIQSSSILQHAGRRAGAAHTGTFSRCVLLCNNLLSDRRSTVAVAASVRPRRCGSRDQLHGGRASGLWSVCEQPCVAGGDEAPRWGAAFCQAPRSHSQKWTAWPPSHGRSGTSCTARSSTWSERSLRHRGTPSMFVRTPQRGEIESWLASNAC